MSVRIEHRRALALVPVACCHVVIVTMFFFWYPCRALIQCLRRMGPGQCYATSMSVPAVEQVISAMHVLEVFTHSVLAMKECTSARVSIHMVLLHLACICCHVCYDGLDAQIWCMPCSLCSYPDSFEVSCALQQQAKETGLSPSLMCILGMLCLVETCS